MQITFDFNVDIYSVILSLFFQSIPQNEPPDSWVLLAAGVLFNTIMGYHLMCFGIYYVKIPEIFGTTKATSGFIISVHGAIGPFGGKGICICCEQKFVLFEQSRDYFTPT